MIENILGHWLEIILGGIVTYIITRIKDIKNRNESTQNGVKALLRDRILAVYETYIQKGYMPFYARENLQEMFKEYKNLGGNGVVDGLITKLYELPTEKPKRRVKE